MTKYKVYVKVVFNRGTLWEDYDIIPYSDEPQEYLARAKWECQKAKNQGYDAFIKAYNNDDETDYRIVKGA